MNQSLTSNRHSKESYILVCSKSLERVAFYGVRSLLILYMVSETIEMSQEDALEVYGWFSGSLLISKFIGGVLGDLTIGNRKAIIFGGIVHALGAFVLCVNSHISIYVGVGLISLGSGFYSPNLLAQFGKHYREKTNLQDAGFMILFMAINFATVIGTTIISYISYQNFSYGFISAGILGLLSVYVFTKSGEPHLTEINTDKRIIRTNYLFIIFILALTIIFGILSEWTSQDLLLIQENITSNSSFFNLSEYSRPSSIGSIFTFLLGIVACIVWTYNYSSQLVKLILSFLLAGFSVGIILFLNEFQSDYSFFAMIFAMLLMAGANNFVLPVTHSAIAKYGDVRYMAIAFSLAVAPWHIMPIIIANMYSGDSMSVLNIGLIAFLLISASLIAIKLVMKKTYNN